MSEETSAEEPAPEDPVFLEDLARVHLEPGDVLVLHVESDLAIGVHRYWEAKLKALWPGHELLILTQGMRLGVMSTGAEVQVNSSSSDTASG